MDYSIYDERLKRVAAGLDRMGADLWMVVTSESSDPCLPVAMGVHTVGAGVFMVSRTGERYVLCTPIDAQDIEASGLFPTVIKYGAGLGPALSELVERLAPARIALNVSEKDSFCDGLTEGRRRWLAKTLAPVFRGEYFSSESFLAELRRS